jgi:hypothetical protein
MVRINKGGRRKNKKVSVAPIHYRIATDLPINAEVAPIDVQNPLAAFGDTDTIRVMRNLRDDPLAGFHSRKQIDQASYLSGREWQRCYEVLMVGGLKAMDFTKEPVDGGGRSDTSTEAQNRARRKLDAASDALGRTNDLLVRRILGDGRSIAEVAGMFGGVEKPSDELIEHWSLVFRTCLNTLAVTFGLAMPHPIAPIHNFLREPHTDQSQQKSATNGKDQPHLMGIEYP